MSALNRSLLILIAAAVASGGPQYSEAQVPQPPEPAQAGDPPDRVGRLSFIEGPVSFLAASADSWAVAEPNRPVTTSDRLWADQSARAEIDIGSTTVRLSSQTELDVLRLNDDWLQMRVPEGTVNLRLKALESDQDDEIDAPNAAIALTGDGEYRVSVSPDGETTTITVWSGTAEVTAAGSSFPVEARQVATLHGDSTITYDLTDAGPPDEFDRWALDRDARADRTTDARKYVAEDTPGIEDLDPYGRWASDADYGPVWYPTTVEVGWAPYRQGHWVWLGRWGWTWVDEAPWGFAPYHYGRWAYVRGRWGWCPGRHIGRPVFAPALVVFVGGSGWDVRGRFGPGGGVAWFPLGPNEVYYPAYSNGLAYRRRINVTNVTNVTVINNVTNVTYRNRGVPGAVTAVPSHVFVGAEPVRHATIEVSEKDLGSAHVGSAAPYAPTRASLVPVVAGRRAAPPPAGLANRAVEATHAPPPAPVPFALQERQLAANGGRPLTRGELTKLRPATPTPGTVTPIHSAIAPGRSPRTLTPARPSLPVTLKPATQVFAPRRSPPVVPAPAPAAPAPRPSEPRATPAPRPVQSPPAAAPTRPAQRPAAAPPANPGQRRGPSSLDRSYQAERESVEARHRQEFAKPPTGESPAAMAQREETEHQQLQERYNQARAAGASKMPPKESPKAPASVPKRDKPAPKPKPNSP